MKTAQCQEEEEESSNQRRKRWTCKRPKLSHGAKGKTSNVHVTSIMDFWTVSQALKIIEHKVPPPHIPFHHLGKFLCLSFPPVFLAFPFFRCLLRCSSTSNHATTQVSKGMTCHQTSSTCSSRNLGFGKRHLNKLHFPIFPGSNRKGILVSFEIGSYMSLHSILKASILSWVRTRLQFVKV